jgi:hypothetical protein
LRIADAPTYVHKPPTKPNLIVTVIEHWSIFACTWIDKDAGLATCWIDGYVNVEITNLGGDAGLSREATVSVELWPSPYRYAFSDHRAVPVPGPGESMPVPLLITHASDEQCFDWLNTEFEVIVDRANRIAESNESNNSAPVVFEPVFEMR